MEAFDIGWIPKGWTKGEPLSVRNIPSIMKWVRGELVDTRTTISLVRQDGPISMSDGPLSLDSVALVTVRVGESEKCNKWLEWWRNEE